ncbi:MAG: DapH/DapD/GlmU-related protein [Bacteroidales bacterium]|nr:DapH/DapD/GlmU-related protein [Bacteroidales bacterium]
MDIVVTGLQAFDNSIGSNCINLALEFSKHHRVLYVNYPVDRLTMFRERHDPKMQKRKRILRGEIENLVKIKDNFWNLYPLTILESISQISNNALFDYLNKINNRRFSEQILLAIRKLDFKDIILFNDSDMFRSFYLKELLHPSLYIYYSRDNLIAVNWWKKQGIRLEAALIKKSDLAVANSTYLANYLKQFNPNSFYVGQGCDVSTFDMQLIKSVPSDIQGITSPIIGYIGVLYTLRLDISIIYYIAKQRPNWSIILIGPEDENFKSSELHHLDNVYFLGSKEPIELPSYLSTFDVAINPQILNKITIGNYPRKIDEYLAMGKPVVATLTEAMKVFEDYSYLANSKEEYLMLIEKALNENSPDLAKKREEFARSHTWEANVNEIYKAIDLIKNTDPSPQNQSKVTLIQRIKSNKKVKEFLIHLMTPRNQARPRYWIKLLVNPFVHKKGKRSLIRKHTRMDVFPWNDFILGDDSTIEDFSTVNNGVGPVIIGNHTRIGLSNVLIGPVKIGNNIMFAQNIVLSGLNHGYEDISIPPSKQKTTKAEIVVEDDVWIGSNSVILAGVTIGKHAVVAAGSIVTKNVPPFSVVGGNPAKILKQYNCGTKTWERKLS